jgi:hypothetical protein
MVASPLTPAIDDVGQLGREAIDRHVRPKLRPEDNGKYIAIDVDTGEYEMDTDDYTANTRLLARRPSARVWLARAGQPATYRMRRSAGRAT